MEKPNLLLLIGASGSGKSSFEKDLLKLPCFNKGTQVTTREPRQKELENGLEYIHLDSVQYVKVVDHLVLKTTVNGKLYGTLKETLVTDRNFINTGIVDYKGVIDSKDYNRVVLELVNNDITEVREGRDSEFVSLEKEKIRLALMNESIIKMEYNGIPTYDQKVNAIRSIVERFDIPMPLLNHLKVLDEKQDTNTETAEGN